ncbi:Polyketide cyclase/dehydrase and lipid transport superfamily protein [Hirschfeldia incana]|nr:Polyketide cyclase/dehydrase and lipid transport superfamily protein [Hirschfeldia incana]
MDESYRNLTDFLRRTSVTETFVDILLCSVPIWLAVMIGLLIGWSWRPRWTGFVYLGLRSKLRFLCTVPPGFGARRVWLAFTALSAFSVCRTLCSRLGSSEKKPEESGETEAIARVIDKETEKEIVTEKDLKHLLHLLKAENANMEWQSMMDKTTPNMSYQAWRHEPQTGPVVYRSRTVFEDASPDIVRDFFWDDEFRPKWDPMLAYFKTLEEDPQTGTTIIHWIKKFPFFCSDREYIIGRRIWESENKYYAVTKGVPYPALPKRDKPRRVELYFSSWIIKAVESMKGDGQLTACEVSLVHCEDMGIPKDVAKLGVRHGMWGAVKKLNSGLRAYQTARKAGVALSRSAQIARITTKLNMDLVETSRVEEEERGQAMEKARRQKVQFSVDWKLVVVGGVALACGLHSSAIGKALMVGAGQRLARR